MHKKKEKLTVHNDAVLIILANALSRFNDVFKQSLFSKKILYLSGRLGIKWET